MFIYNRDLAYMQINFSASEVIVNRIICDQRKKQHINTIIPNVIHKRYGL